MRRHRALIVGGSLGGLFAANVLRSIGWDVLVFERVAEDLATRGAGLGTHDELYAVMARIGFRIDETIGVRIDSRVCLDQAGRTVHEVPWRQLMSAWARIYRPLRDAIPDESYRSSMLLDHVEQDSGSVTAVFADGSRETGDLLVAADGIRSTVRGQLLPEAEPHYAGYIAWRGLIQEPDVPPFVHESIFERYAFCLPEGEMMLSYPVPGRGDDTRPGRRAYNFVWYRPASPEQLSAMCTDAEGHQHGLSIAPPLIRPEIVAKMRAHAQAVLAPQYAELVASVEQPFFQAIFDLESPRIVFGRVALLGDSAFVARPHVGAGVTKAALDAQGLGDALRAANGDLTVALARYEQERRRFGARLVARGQRLGAYLEAQLKPPEARRDDELVQQPETVLREVGAPLGTIDSLWQ